MNKCFRVIFIVISIIKVDIIKIYTKNTHFITKKYDITRIFEIVKTELLSFAYEEVRSFLLVLFAANQAGINFNAGRQSSITSSHILWDLYQNKLLAWKDLQKEFCHTFLKFYINQEHKQMHENIYQ